MEQEGGVCAKSCAKKRSYQREVFDVSHLREEIRNQKQRTTRIKELLKKVFMFQELDPKSIEIIISAMIECKFAAGESIISQGDEGNCLYILESGTCSCFRRFVRTLRELL